jgi:hypothetical protein
LTCPLFRRKNPNKKNGGKFRRMASMRRLPPQNIRSVKSLPAVIIEQ